MKKSYKYRYLIMILCLLFVVGISLSWGTYRLTPLELMNTLLGNGSKMQQTVVFTLRLPRILVALVVGLALSTAGCILQSATKNDLAEPGVIGINAGASLAVVVLISTGLNYYSDISNIRLFLMPVVAMVGAFFAAFLVFTFSKRKGKMAPTRMILVGIGVNAGLNAVVTLYQLNMSGGDYNRALTWISGSLWGSSWKFFWLVAPFILVLTGITMYKNKVMDVLDLGDELATGLGVSVERSRPTLLFLGVGLAALATAVAGNIAFLGLIGPHIARSIVGPLHKRLIPMAALVSGIIIVFADTISRNVFSPIEIPVGITISMVGVPYFIYLMLKR